ncbi:MAG: fructose-specific PTS transporter subunit EIIC [Micrococcales bacterium]|nr:fructose-specific PTS transporter subunit EIIC [Micrococcales bacterium]
MTDTQLITPDLVALDENLGSDKSEVIRALATKVADTGRASDVAGLLDDALAREAKSGTGLPGGIAIPHCRSTTVTEPTLAFARLDPKVDFGAKDGPADIVFLIAAPEGGGQEHMKLLTKLARALVKKDFVASLRAAQSKDELVALVDGVVNPAPRPEANAAGAPAAAATGAAAATAGVGASAAGASAPATSASPTTSAGAGDPAAAPAAYAQDEQPATTAGARSVVAITACPTGIAHTYMAADSLTDTGKEMGVDVLVETQGSAGSTPLTAAQIAAADAVIFATDVGVKGRERFAGKPVIESGVKRAINEPRVMLEEALAAADNPNARRVAGTAGAAAAEETGPQLSFGKRIQQALMTGVSYMIPFVAAGGLLIALGFLFGGYDITAVADKVVAENSLTNLPDPTGHALFGSSLMTYLGAVMFKLGGLGFGFLVPALAGYIAFALADRPGIAPGFITGAVAGAVGAGFIGGLVGGLLAGAIAHWLTTFRPPRWLAGLMPVVIIPLVTTLLAGGLMYVLLGKPLASLLTALTDWLAGMSGTSAVLLGVIVGLMMCFDLGGPVNKAAYLFATTGLDVNNTASMKVMAAVMAAGMVPPIALALATQLRPGLFTPSERENGRAAWLLGASFISEGAIPFAAADPLRIIPSMMVGGAVTGALSMLFQAASKAPHGGVFVFFAIDRFLLWLLAIVIGAVISAVITMAVKSMGRKDTEVEPARVAA